MSVTPAFVFLLLPALALAEPVAITIEQGGTVRVYHGQSVRPKVHGNAQHLTGKLEVLHEDDFASGKGKWHYHVRGSNGRLTELNVEILPSTIRGGSNVDVQGTTGSAPDSLDPQTITVTAEPQAVVTPNVNSTLVIVANYSDKGVGTTQSAIQSAMVPVAAYFEEVSYDQQELAVTVTPVLTASLSSASGCDYTSIASAWNSAATAAGFNPANYGFLVYLFPSSSCGWAGLAYVRSPHQAWINGPGYFKTQPVTHEMGHNFGNYHAGSVSCLGSGCTASEYGDPYDTMGNKAAGHYDAYQKVNQLGWIPTSAVKTYTIGQAATQYTLDPIEVAGGSVYAVKIPTSNALRTYWVEYRQPVGFDNGIAPDAVQVRVSRPFETTSGADDTEIVPNGVVAAGGSYTDMVAGITITVGPAAPPPPAPPLTLFYQDAFDAAAIDPHWTVKGTGGVWVQGSSIVAQTSTSSGDPKKLQLADGTAISSVQEIIAKVRVDKWNGGDYARAGVCVLDDANGNGYNLVFHGTNQVQFLNDHVVWGNSYSFPWNVGQWYWFRLTADSQGLHGKVWADGTTEPTTFAFNQPGWITRTGVPGLNGSSSGNGSAMVSFDSVTINSQ